MMFERWALTVLFKRLSYFLTNSPFFFSFWGWLRPLDVTARKTVKNLQGQRARMLINLHKPPGGGVLWVKCAIPSWLWLSAFHSSVLLLLLSHELALFKRSRAVCSGILPAVHRLHSFATLLFKHLLPTFLLK